MGGEKILILVFKYLIEAAGKQSRLWNAGDNCVCVCVCMQLKFAIGRQTILQVDRAVIDFQKFTCLEYIVPSNKSLRYYA